MRNYGNHTDKNCSCTVAKLVKVWSSFSKLAGDGTPQEVKPLGVD